MIEEIKTALQAICKELFNLEQIEPGISRPEEQFGDYATNIALQLSGRLGKNPSEIAQTLSNELRSKLGDKVSEVIIAGPGFINIKLSDKTLLDNLGHKPAQALAGKTVVAEYSDPNPFKLLHAGHLYTSIVGDAIANLLESAGGIVHRVNFGGDVGLHVGKTIWAILFSETNGNIADEDLALSKTQEQADKPLVDRASWLGGCYVQGTAAYEDDETAKDAITALNKRIYQIHTDRDHESSLAQIYWLCRGWSYEYFDAFYDRIGTHFEKYYPESETMDIGLQTVKAHIGDVFEESDGAVIFDGEKFGLHTRVFINSQGLPTYEAKEVGLSMKKWDDYHFDRSIIITGNEQEQYMAVVIKAIEQFAPELANNTSHLTHGMVKLAGGVKMSSRKGNILRATEVVDAAANANKELSGKDDPMVTLGAVKYALLKQRTGGDIIYDPKESVSLEGNSGPYLQYAHARARSILRKVDGEASGNQVLDQESAELEPEERSLVRKITEYPEAVDRAVAELMPHHICSFLYELAQVFNRFYEHNRVIGDARESLRCQLVEQYADTLKSGLELLGIAALDKM